MQVAMNEEQRANATELFDSLDDEMKVAAVRVAINEKMQRATNWRDLADLIPGETDHIEDSERRGGGRNVLLSMAKLAVSEKYGVPVKSARAGIYAIPTTRGD